MSTHVDIANWAVTDMLHRVGGVTFGGASVSGGVPDQDVYQRALTFSTQFYQMLCDAVPFDELRTTSAEFALTAGQGTYAISTFIPTAGSFSVPALRAIANLRITFDTNTKRRLRKSHVRVYDALSITPNSRPATYARWGGNLEFNPPPDSSSYTIRFRYWFRPFLGGAVSVPATVTTTSWAAGGIGTVTYATLGSSPVQVIPGSTITIAGVNPGGYNIANAVVLSSNYNYSQQVPANNSTGSLTLTYALTNNPGAYVSGGTVIDTSPWATPILTPPAWDELIRWETLYRVYVALNQPEKAMALVQPPMQQMQQGSPRKQTMYQVGIIPRLWNDLLKTVDQVENVDEDFSINPVIRPYSVR